MFKFQAEAEVLRVFVSFITWKKQMNAADLFQFSNKLVSQSYIEDFSPQPNEPRLERCKHLNSYLFGFAQVIQERVNIPFAVMNLASRLCQIKVLQNGNIVGTEDQLSWTPEKLMELTNGYSNVG